MTEGKQRDRVNSPPVDNHGRVIRYLRLAVTDRCNLRCQYCMPQEGIDFRPRTELLTYEEMLRLCRIFTEMGITKIRITGGEPFLRKDVENFLIQLRQLPELTKLTVTTNGVFTARFLPKLRGILDGINLSLDTLSPRKFEQITRRSGFAQVMETFHTALALGISVKLNVVVLDGINTDEFPSFLQLAAEYPIHVRFIEQMPFDGRQGVGATRWTAAAIVEHLHRLEPQLEPMETDPDATAQLFTAPGWQGAVGVIAGFSRTFCHTCSRIRLTPTGVLKTCLYDHGVDNLRDRLRAGATDEQIKEIVLLHLQRRFRNGYEAEQFALPVVQSMATIGG